jgi:hypothetical protein
MILTRNCPSGWRGVGGTPEGWNMKQSLQFGKGPTPFIVCLRGTSFCLLRAIAFLFIAKTCLVYAVAQVTLVPPFIGTHSETWEEFGITDIPSGTSILGGIATISGDHMVTDVSFQMCTVIGRPSDGNVLMDSDRPSGPLTISFSQPVSAFGAYWGSGIGCIIYGFPDAPSILTFQDVNGNVIGTDSFLYTGDGTLMWRGYQFDTPIQTIIRIAGDGLEGVAIDGLQATVAPTPTPTPDPCYSNFTTVEGCDALNSLTTGAGNTALGWRSLFLDTTGSFNTGAGGGALVLNNGSSNTAVGAAALLLNNTGNNNTALGTDTLVFNDSGEANTATGYFALMNNTAGGSNTAIGSEALTANTSGNNNTAIGNLALQSSETTSDNVCVGREAGSGITTANNNIIIGHHSGVHSVLGQENDRCFIDNIFGAPVSAATAAMVMVDSDGRLGTVTAEGPAKGTRPQANPDAAKQAVLGRTVDSLQATITQQQQQIDGLTAQLKEQTAQIQNVNAQLEMSKPATKVIANKP